MIIVDHREATRAAFASSSYDWANARDCFEYRALPAKRRPVTMALEEGGISFLIQYDLSQWMHVIALNRALPATRPVTIALEGISFLI